MIEKTIAALEALLFIYGEPLEFKKAAAVLKVGEDEVIAFARELQTQLASSARGLQLVIHDKKLQITTKPEFGKLLETVLKAELHEALTPAALETISVIAYGAPISRSEIDYIRGVNSSFTLRALLLRGLIERSLDPKRANAYLYSPTFDFLKHLGLSKIEDLPEYEKFRTLATNLKPAEPTAAAPATGATENKPQ